MTSNIPGGRAGAEGFFKPEFINRLDDIVEFAALSREQIGAIVDLQVAQLIAARRRPRRRGRADRLRPRADRQPRLRPDLRRPPAQARHPEAPRRRPRPRDPRGRLHDRRPHAVDNAYGNLTFQVGSAPAGSPHLTPAAAGESRREGVSVWGPDQGPPVEPLRVSPSASSHAAERRSPDSPKAPRLTACGAGRSGTRHVPRRGRNGNCGACVEKVPHGPAAASASLTVLRSSPLRR